MLAYFALEADADMENDKIDSTIVRAHPSAAGALKNKEHKRLDEAVGDSAAKSMLRWIVWAIWPSCA